ncbi:MAG: SDR family oxidoreductase [Clostridia bacterium]|nr:SDR family oxidoreductase [Clostridia bacterium]
MFDLTGKRALVTGSTQGIGFEIARMLAEHGATVYIHGASNVQKCVSASNKIKGSTPVLANLLFVEEIDALYEKTGDVDILVLNASIQYKRKWDEFTLEEYEEQMNCNVRASYLLMKKYAEGMKAKGWGRIVALGSVNQYNQHPELSVYGATKAAQFKLVRNFAPILASYGITVNNVCPGAIETPRNEDVCSDPQKKAAVVAKIPCGRFGLPSDISPAVLLLCSDEGAYITGSEIVIDGGLSLK